MISIEKAVIPNDYEAEQAVLGSIIYDNQTYPEARSKLLPESFYTPSHQHIFRAMIKLYETKSPIDELLLGDQLKKNDQLEEVGGYAYLSTLQDCFPGSGNIGRYASIIEEKDLLRKLITIGSDLSRKARDQRFESGVLLAQTLKLLESTTTRSTSFSTLKDVLAGVILKAEEAQNTKEDAFIGYPTGFHEYDAATSGLQPSDLIIIAGRPSMGKTALACDIVKNAAHISKLHALIYTHEMSKDKIAMRMLCSEAQLVNNKVRRGRLEQSEWDRLIQANGNLSNLNISIDDSENLAIEELIARTMAEHYINPVHLVMVDYLQLLKTLARVDNRSQVIGTISRGCKSLAKKLNAPVILLSQLNRKLEERRDKRPILSDLRESGDIEQDADIILFPYRDEVYHPNNSKPGETELIIAKFRDGPPTKVDLHFEGRFTRFSNPNESQQRF